MLGQEGAPRPDWGAGLPGGQKVIREAAGVDPRVWVPPVQRGPVTSRASPSPSSLQGDGNPAADPPLRVLRDLPAWAHLGVCASAWADSGDPSGWGVTPGSDHSLATWQAPHL